MSSFKGKTTDTDLGAERILEEAAKAQGAYVDIGYFGDEAHPDGELTVVGIAAVHEFGSEKRNIPERPFIRTTADENQDKWQRRLDKFMGRILEGKTDLLSSLTAFGELAVSAVRKKITDIKLPELAEATARRKGSSNPLIDTGFMRAFCRSRVVIEGMEVHVSEQGAVK